MTPSGPGPRVQPSPWWQAALVLAVIAQLLVLYLPSTPGPPSAIPGFDKYVHAGVFAAVAVCARLVGFRVVTVAAALIAHAVASELIQHYLLPQRSGDWRDVLADVGGVVLGLLAAWGMVARAARRHHRS